MVIVVFLIVYYLRQSRLGLAWVAIREDEEAAKTTGVNTFRAKTIAFLLSAMFPGIVGGIYAYYISFIGPPTVFGEYLSSEMVLMAVIGGRGDLLGPLIGAAFCVALSELIRVFFTLYHLVIYGALLIIVVIFAPRGIVRYLRRIFME